MLITEKEEAQPETHTGVITYSDQISEVGSEALLTVFLWIKSHCCNTDLWPRSSGIQGALVSVGDVVRPGLGVIGSLAGLNSTEDANVWG